MIFTLEALNAHEGDCLLLHYGHAEARRLIVIDGGPRRTYAEVLLPRLLELRQALAGEQALAIELMVVTHVDSDHISGIVAMTEELRALKGARRLPVAIKELWHNGFDDVVGGHEVEDAVEFVNDLPLADTAGLVASIGEGRALLGDAEVLGIRVNAEFDGLVARADDGGVEIPCGDGLTLTVLGPARKQLADFQRAWDAARKAARKGEGKVSAATALDTSKPNLASITLLAELGGRTMLLAGDARGDHLLAGLEVAGKLPPDGALHVDVFKLPHHGSCRNCTAELLRRVTADAYVISADGKHGNPDRETLQRLSEARAGARYKVICTFPEAAYRAVEGDAADAKERREALRAFHEWARRLPAEVEVVYREPDAYGVTIALGERR